MSQEYLFRGLNAFTSFISGEKNYLFLKDHMRRLCAGSQYLFPEEYHKGNERHFYASITHFLEDKFLPHTYYRLTVLPSEICYFRKQIKISDDKIKIYLAKNIKNENSFPTFLKHPQYLLGWDEKKNMNIGLSDSEFDVVFLDRNGLVTESSTSNIFVLSDSQTVLTPRVSSKVLDGVLRKNLIAFFPSIGIKVLETDVTPSDLANAKEIILTNSVGGIRHVTHYDDHVLFESNEFVQRIYEQFGRFGEKITYE